MEIGVAQLTDEGPVFPQLSREEVFAVDIVSGTAGMYHGLLPIGVAEGCRLRRDIPRDQVLTYADVEVPEGRLCDQLRAEQSAFTPQPALRP